MRKHTALTNHAPGLVRVAVHTEAVEQTAEAAPLPDQTDLLLPSFPRSVTTRMSTGYVSHEPGSQQRLQCPGMLPAAVLARLTNSCALCCSCSWPGHGSCSKRACVQPPCWGQMRPYSRGRRQPMYAACSHTRSAVLPAGVNMSSQHVWTC